MSNVTRAPEGRRDRCQLSALRCFGFVGFNVFVAALATLLTACASSDSWALPEGDLQFVAVGNGFPDTLCVTGGTDVVVQTLPNGDDRLVYSKPPVVIPVFILSGANGICETTKIGNDNQDIEVGEGEENRGIIFSAGPTGDTGICDNAYVGLDYDNVLVADGKSTPRQVGVKAGADNVLQSVVLGDDVSTAAICPGSDGILQSDPVSGDDAESSDLRCQQLCGVPSITCILPGPIDLLITTNDVLTTTVDAADSRVIYVSTGANGISQTTAATGDVQAIPSGRGLQGTVCVDAGPDGIAATTACGNSQLDALRVGNQIRAEECDAGVANSTASNAACRPSCTLRACGDSVIDGGFGESCDDGNLTNGDGCSRQCQPGTCGNGIPEAGEECDFGPSVPCDNCNAECEFANCGDGEVCGDEQCDGGGETAACNINCTPTICGDGILNTTAGEECDVASRGDSRPCLMDCKLADCGDKKLCDDPSCTSGPGDGPEECDDGNHSNRDACVKGCANATCGDEVVEREPVSVEDCDPPDQNPVCVVGRIDSPCSNNADCNIVGVNGLCGIQCDGNCQDVSGNSCLDGTRDPGEDCDDGNHSNRDDCTSLCRAARCGDGQVHELGSGLEQCDDGNLLAEDDCDSHCRPRCGNGVVDGHCTLGAIALVGTECTTDTACGESAPGSADGNCAKDEFCDVGCGAGVVDGSCVSGRIGEDCANNTDCNSSSSGSNDGVCEGSGCGSGCTDGLSDGVCTVGLVSSKCKTNSSCDSSPGFGNGVCVGHTCGPVGLGAVCVVDPTTGVACSEKCDISFCGNSLTECFEECDLGDDNGTVGSGCDVLCKRTLVGQYETGASPRTKRECPTAWLYETRKAKVDLAQARFVCEDGSDQCDWDTMPDQCTFRIGVCLNRPGVGTCSDDPGGIVAWELRGLKVAQTGNRHGDAADTITSAVAKLVADNNPIVTAVLPGRCVKGLKAKSCTVGADYECDPTFGSGTGVCDITTGVLFQPMLFPSSVNWCATGDVGAKCDDNADCGEDDEGNDGVCRPGDQTAACTDTLSIEVNAGESLKLRSKARRARGASDTDRIQLSCQRDPTRSPP